MDEGGFVLDYLTPPGTSLSERTTLVRQMEAKVDKLRRSRGIRDVQVRSWDCCNRAEQGAISR
jgi:hypothetical protein